MNRQAFTDRFSDESLRQKDALSIRAISRGVPEALGAAYIEHKKAVLAAITRLLIDRSVAEDLAQETFLLLPQALKNFRGGCSLRTFIVSIGVNLARHHVRNTVRREKSLVKYAQMTGLTKVVSPEQLLLQRQLGKSILRALELLSYEKQETFLLREFHEHSSLETAKMVAVPEATVRTRVHHARRTLQQALSIEGYERAA
jgi:RNA polymerase sigma-70 factor (ECF subfamily)